MTICSPARKNLILFSLVFGLSGPCWCMVSTAQDLGQSNSNQPQAGQPPVIQQIDPTGGMQEQSPPPPAVNQAPPALPAASPTGLPDGLSSGNGLPSTVAPAQTAPPAMPTGDAAPAGSNAGDSGNALSPAVNSGTSGCPAAGAQTQAPAEEKSSAVRPERKKKRNKDGEGAQPAVKKQQPQGYYGSFGRTTDEGISSDAQKRYGGEGYYSNVKPAVNLPPVEMRPVFSAPPQPVQQQYVPPRPVDPSARKFEDDPGQLGSITFTRHVKSGKEMAATGRYDLAKQHFKEALRAKPDQVSVYPELWESCVKTNDWSEALHSLDQMFKLDPSKEKEYGWARGIALYKLVKYDQAVPYLNKTLAYGQHLDEVHMALLRIAQQQKDSAEVIKQYGALLKLKPQDHDTQLQFAILLESMGRYPEAMAHYKAAVDIDPRDGTVISRLAYLMMSQNKDWDGAISMYQKAILVDSKNAGKYQQSIKYAQQQLQLANKKSHKAKEQ